MTKADIINKAERFCKENNIGSYPVDVVKLCRARDIWVFECLLPSDVSGFIVIQDEPFENFGTGRLIAVNVSDSAARKRFTIAHELAHFILHKKEGEAIYAHRDAGQSNEIERQANTFASNILMPKPLVLDVLSGIARGAHPSVMVDRVSYCFAVSADAAAVRLSQLGYVRGHAYGK